MPCFSTLDEQYSWQLSFEKTYSAEVPTCQALRNKNGSGMTELRLGCHTGLICQMPAKDAYCCYIVTVWFLAKETASVIELPSAVAHSASVKGGAQIVQVTSF